MKVNNGSMNTEIISNSRTDSKTKAESKKIRRVKKKVKEVIEKHSSLLDDARNLEAATRRIKAKLKDKIKKEDIIALPKDNEIIELQTKIKEELSI